MSEFRGVYFDASSSHRKPWRASIGTGAEKTHLGRFPTEAEAAAAYDFAAKRKYGEYAKPNFQDAAADAIAKK
jgi:hypothetical protein